MKVSGVCNKYQDEQDGTPVRPEETYVQRLYRAYGAAAEEIAQS